MVITHFSITSMHCNIIAQIQHLTVHNTHVASRHTHTDKQTDLCEGLHTLKSARGGGHVRPLLPQYPRGIGVQWQLCLQLVYNNTNSISLTVLFISQTKSQSCSVFTFLDGCRCSLCKDATVSWFQSLALFTPHVLAPCIWG